MKGGLSPAKPVRLVLLAQDKLRAVERFRGVTLEFHIEIPLLRSE